MQPWSARFLPGLSEGSVRLHSLPSQILIHYHEERSLWLWDPPTRLVLLLAKPLGAQTPEPGGKMAQLTTQEEGSFLGLIHTCAMAIT